MDYFGQVTAAADAIRARVSEFPSTAIVLGSGLGEFAGALGAATSMRYGELPFWPVPQVEGHEGRLVVGTSNGRPVAALAGRCHFYEGYDGRTVTFGIRVLGLLGVKVLILTNAAGGVNTSFSAGALMLIDDHINLMGQNPLAGANDDRFGPRFPDMSAVYSARLRQFAADAGRTNGMSLAHGIYAALLGPSYETPA
ncbi:MAG TPA: purine-nucleoside phosphorylase, partial [Vicinamibacterales bacterium]|nr:purine-nucleoside phosphorylase [Vicinamibacterales bacterium]